MDRKEQETRVARINALHSYDGYRGDRLARRTVQRWRGLSFEPTIDATECSCTDASIELRRQGIGGRWVQVPDIYDETLVCPYATEEWQIGCAADLFESYEQCAD